VEVLLKDTDFSCRGIAKSLHSEGVSASKSLVARVAKTLKMRYYIKPIAQFLTEAHIKRRLEFAHSLLLDIRNGVVDVNNIIFTDECMLGNNPASNRQNDGVWRMAGEYDDWREDVSERRVRCVTTHVFVAIHA